MEANSCRRSAWGVAGLIMPIALLCSCGDAAQDPVRTSPLGKTSSQADGGLRQYAPIMLKGTREAPVRVYASRRPGAGVDEIIEIDPVGSGQVIPVTISCESKTMTFLAPYRLSEGRRTPDRLKGTPDRDAQGIVDMACSADWANSVTTSGTDVGKALRGLAPRRTARPTSGPKVFVKMPDGQVKEVPSGPPRGEGAK